MLPTDMPAAVISSCGQYRYLLTRRLGFSDRVMTFIGLNPSTADAIQDDPTIRRCISFAKRQDAGVLVMVNLFGLRSTDPKALKDCEDPVGPDNDSWINTAVCSAYMTVAAWGNGGVFMGRADEIRQRYKGCLHALALTKSNLPKHPLYIRGDAVPVPY